MMPCHLLQRTMPLSKCSSWQTTRPWYIVWVPHHGTLCDPVSRIGHHELDALRSPSSKLGGPSSNVLLKEISGTLETVPWIGTEAQINCMENDPNPWDHPAVALTDISSSVHAYGLMVVSQRPASKRKKNPSLVHRRMGWVKLVRVDNGLIIPIQGWPWTTEVQVNPLKGQAT